MHRNEKNRYIASWLAALVLAGIPAALANQTDGSTVTAVTQEADPLDKYRKAKELSDTELKEMLSLVGFEGRALKVAWAVAKKESNGRPRAHNDNISTGDDSYGLFQINMLGSLGNDRREKFGITKNTELFDPVENAKAAYYMTAKGTNWGSWGYGPRAYDGSSSEPKIDQWLAKYPKQ